MNVGTVYVMLQIPKVPISENSYEIDRLLRRKGRKTNRFTLYSVSMMPTYSKVLSAFSLRNVSK